MKSFRTAILAAVLFAAVLPAFAADPVVRFPDPPAPAPRPQPMPGPVAPARLTADQFYVFESDVPVIVLSSPAGLVAVVESPGPLMVRGRFYDGTKVETRVFKGKSVFTVEVLATGRVELIVIPAGATKAEDAVRRTLDVDAGTGPLPPPEDPFAKSLAAAFALETTDRPLAAQLSALYVRGGTLAQSAGTWGKLFEQMAAEAATLGVAGKLQVVQKVVQTRLQSRLPWKGASDQPITADGMMTAQAEFAAVAAALAALK